VIVDQLTKSTHFIPVSVKYRAEKYAEIYSACVLCLHEVPNMIVSDRESQFITHFWEQLHVSLGTHLIHSLVYDPQTDGQTERVNQILEDMLRACMMENQGNWDKHLPLAEFSYNNSYQESLKMAPFEVLYRRQCHTPLNCIKPREKVIFGPNIIDEAEAMVHHIQDNL
jgi:transposase InsO family protein